MDNEMKVFHKGTQNEFKAFMATNRERVVTLTQANDRVILTLKPVVEADGSQVFISADYPR